MSDLYHPHHLDGRCVVILRSAQPGYAVVESGRLLHDGTTLWLIRDQGEREVDADELGQFKFVTPGNGIALCHGFDLFRILDS